MWVAAWFLGQAGLGLRLLSPLREAVPRVTAAALVVLMGLLLGALLVGVARRGLARGGIRRDVRRFLGRVAWFFVLFFTAAAALNALGLGEVALALGGAVAFLALAVGTAVGTIVADFVSGAFLLADEDFDAGMRVTTGEVTGTLESVDMRKSRIRDDDGKLHVVPNHTVDEEPWTVEAREGAPAVDAEQTHLDEPRWVPSHASAVASGAPPVEAAEDGSEGGE